LRIDGDTEIGGAAVYGGGKWVEIHTLQTRTGTEQTLCSITLDDNSAYFVHATIVGMESDGSDRNLYDLQGLFYRDGGGALQQGITTSLTTIQSAPTATGSLDTDTNDVRVRVSGPGLETWNWKVKLEYFKVV
jgi:hypothetical protein